jgi:hypothetical protein
MLRLMLTTHPQLVVPPECGFMVWLQPEFGHWNVGELGGQKLAVRFVDAVVATRKFDTWGLTRDEVGMAVTARRPKSYADACDAIYRSFAKHFGKPDAEWGDKNNYYLSHIATISSIYPDARFIHIVRDGRDVACSYREVMASHSDSQYRPILPVKIDEIARQWASNISAIRAQFAVLRPKSFLQIRYEDLTENPERELTRACNWLGVKFEPKMLEFFNDNRALGLEPSATIDWKRRTLQPVCRDSVGRYMRLLSVTETAEFHSIAGAELQLYGYMQ